MTQKGKVVSVNGGIARVRVIRRSACDGCRQKSMCSGMSDGCDEQQPLEADAKNTAGAVAGDEVIVETKSETVLFWLFQSLFCRLFQRLQLILRQNVFV